MGLRDWERFWVGSRWSSAGVIWSLGIFSRCWVIDDRLNAYFLDCIVRSWCQGDGNAWMSESFSGDSVDHRTTGSVHSPSHNISWSYYTILIHIGRLEYNKSSPVDRQSDSLVVPIIWHNTGTLPLSAWYQSDQLVNLHSICPTTHRPRPCSLLLKFIRFLSRSNDYIRYRDRSKILA